MNRTSPWKPPTGRVALDLAGIALPGPGLRVHSAPGAAGPAVALAPFRLHLLVLGGLLIAAGGGSGVPAPRDP